MDINVERVLEVGQIEADFGTCFCVCVCVCVSVCACVCVCVCVCDCPSSEACESRHKPSLNRGSPLMGCHTKFSGVFLSVPSSFPSMWKIHLAFHQPFLCAKPNMQEAQKTKKP